MRRSMTNWLLCTICGGMVLVAAAVAAGQEPARPAHRVECEIDLQWPLTGNLVYLKEVLEQLGKSHEQKAACQAPACPAEKAIGFDFHVIPGSQVLVLPDPAAHCTTGVCQANACALPATSAVSACGKCCPAECCVSGCAAKCGTATATHVTAKAGCACDDCECHKCQCIDCPCRPAAHTASSQCQRDKFWEHLVEISSEKAALEAALEAHTSFTEERNEMFGSLAELMTENAKLTAKVELQGERDELVKQMLELTAQNAQLKASAELADARIKLMQESLELAVQNQRLAHRVAELEQQAGQESARATRATKRVR